jgi:L-aspartate oxidase
LLSEALRGEGGILRNADLHRFMKHYHEAGELAPRDVVARAIVSEMQKTGAEFVYLDMTGKNQDYVRKRFPHIYATCQQFGLDIAADLIPVRPAAHYSMGGVKSDLWGRTTIPGLFAAGETACTGVHGANRLASNSLLEGLVYGARAGQAMREHAQPKAASGKATAKGFSPAPDSSANAAKKPHDNPIHGRTGNHGAPPSKIKSKAEGTRSHLHTSATEQIRNILWHDVGIIRSGKGMAHALEALKSINLPSSEMRSRADCELRNLWTLAQLITRCALAREESRGSHYRSDFPCPDEKFRKHSIISKGADVSFE